MNDQLSISREHRAKNWWSFDMAFPFESAIWQRNRQLIYSYKMRTWENLRWVVFLSPRTSIIHLQGFRCLLDGTRKVLGISLSLPGFWPFIKCLERILMFACFCYYCFRKPSARGLLFFIVLSSIFFTFRLTLKRRTLILYQTSTRCFWNAFRLCLSTVGTICHSIQLIPGEFYRRPERSKEI